jgi:peptidoglycan/xylan/chitin deacetylase (PgdA/CDA1 family)
MKAAKALPILMYHHVSPNPGLVTVSPATFRAHMAVVAKAGWKTAGLQTVEAFFAGEPVPAKTCIVTFDDGYLDNGLHAAPVLAELGMQAVIFTVTSWMGDGVPRSGGQDSPDHRECKRRIAAGDADSVILRWSEAELLQAAGVFEFHSHTHSHTRWDKTIVDLAARKSALLSDLAASRSALQQRLGIESRHLCWPQGYFDTLYIESACSVGFDHLYTTVPTINRPTTPTDRIARFVTKERPGKWLEQRTRLYANPLLGTLYSWIKR